MKIITIDYIILSIIYLKILKLLLYNKIISDYGNDGDMIIGSNKFIKITNYI